MVTVKSQKTKSTARFTTRLYLLVASAACLLCGTGVFVATNTNTNSNNGSVQLRSGSDSGIRGLLMMVDAHSARTLLRKPHLVYGTAWKKEETARLVSEAIRTGFRFIDTACQPRHYNEAGVGNGWTAAAQELGLDRADLWLQTKFTPVSGQDPNNIPYDPKLPVADQARASLKVSLRNLKTDYLDSWVLHSPLEAFEDTMAVWRVMEEAVDAGTVRQLGISNCYDMDTFRLLYQQARHKPAVLQNRFYAETKFDTPLRHFCRDREIRYQSFWTLTANRKALATEKAAEWASEKDLTAQTLMFAFLMSLGYVTPLSGTTNPVHMAHDVAIMERLQGGEQLFSEDEQLRFAELLGMPKL